MEYTTVIRGVFVVNLKELHQEFFIAILNRNIGCFQSPEHLPLMVEGETLVSKIKLGCLEQCVVDVVISFSLFHF